MPAILADSLAERRAHIESGGDFLYTFFMERKLEKLPMKQYTIHLEKQESDFYEKAAADMNMPVEDLLQAVLLKYAADLAKKALAAGRTGEET